MRQFYRFTATFLIALMFWNSSYAAVATPPSINTVELLDTQSNLRGELTRALQDQKVLTELSKMGVSKGEVEMRLAAMSDKELQQVQLGLERQAGGDVVVISVTTLLLGIIILILLLR